MNLPVVEITQKEIDVFNLAIGTTTIRKLNPEQKSELLKYVKILDGTPDINAILTSKICDDWKLFQTKGKKNIGKCLDRICKRYFEDIKEGKRIIRKKIGRKKKFPLALPEEKGAKEALENELVRPIGLLSEPPVAPVDSFSISIPSPEQIQASQLDKPPDPLVEQAKLLDKLWGEFEYWSLKARVDEQPSLVVVKYLETIRNTIKDILDTYQKLKATSPGTGRGDNGAVPIFIEKMQIAIEQNITNREGVNNVLSDLTTQLESISVGLPSSLPLESLSTPPIDVTNEG